MRSHEKKRYHDGLIRLKELCLKLFTVEAGNIFEVLSDCQQYIVALENKLEKDSHKEDIANLIPKLESLAEQIYITSKSGFSGNSVQVLVDEVQDIIDYLETVPCRKEIVFLPYKASMWDAFDSVYQAAMQDLDANVIVMPIPYRSFDKKTECWNEHYEVELFPGDIQTTDYRAYELEEMRPDVIFIHNPYDQYNYVTRVHEEFFSSKLINCTDHLVYIPYDVVLGSKIDENYCKMPGVQNAWKVIVQSESIRQDYIKWVSPEKVLALGSPKIDAVVNYKVDWNQLPNSWKEKCENKKVFLYNTHLNGIITDGYLLIKRLQNVWEYFHEHQGITLLWRPHPLSVQTAEAMNPDFLQSYLQMVEKFKKLDNCIYDDTPDLNRAMAISDAYIGDYSSLVMLYGFTGKPMYLHSPENRNMGEIERNSLLCVSALIHEGKMWLCHNMFNGLFEMNTVTGEVRFITEIYGENRNQEDLFSDIIYHNDRLILIPQNANHIVEYDLATGNQRRIKIDSQAQCDIKFSAKIRKGNEIFLFPLQKPNNGIMLNLDSFVIKTFDIGYKQINTLVHNLSDYIFGDGGVYLDGEMFVPLRNVPVVACYSSGKVEFYKIINKNNGFRYIAYSQDNFFLSVNNSNEVIIWNRADGLKERLVVSDEVLGVEDATIENFVVSDDCLWIIPAHGINVVKYSMKKKKFQIIIEINKVLEGFEDYVIHFCGMQEDNNTIYLMPYRTNLLIEIDKKNDTYKVKRAMLPKQQDDNWKQKYIYESCLSDREGLNYKEYIFLDTTCKLDEFIEGVQNNNITKLEKRKKAFGKGMMNIAGNAGAEIYRNVSNAL